MPCHSKTLRIDGAWRMESYVRNHEPVPLTGVLLMTEGRWSTLYFIFHPGTSDSWGSAESGRFELKDGQLTFHHEFTFQGGAGKQPVMDLASSTVEACGIELTGEILTIHFPGGNVIRCRRFSR